MPAKLIGTEAAPAPKQTTLVLYYHGNPNLLNTKLAYYPDPKGEPTDAEIDAAGKWAYNQIWERRVIVAGVDTPLQQEVACGPLPWADRRILVLPGSLKAWLGKNLDQPPFRLSGWPTEFDPWTELALSLVGVDGPKFVSRPRVVSKLIKSIANREIQFELKPATDQCFDPPSMEPAKPADYIAWMIQEMDRGQYLLLVSALEKLGGELRIEPGEFARRAKANEKPGLEVVDGEDGAVVLRLKID